MRKIAQYWSKIALALGVACLFLVLGACGSSGGHHPAVKAVVTASRAPVAAVKPLTAQQWATQAVPVLSGIAVDFTALSDNPHDAAALKQLTKDASVGLAMAPSSDDDLNQAWRASMNDCLTVEHDLKTGDYADALTDMNLTISDLDAIDPSTLAS